VRTLLTSTDRPLVETVRATLEAEGIGVVVEGDAVTALPFIPMNVLVPESDAVVAQELVKDLLDPATRPSGIERRRWARVFLAVILFVALVLCGNLLIG
jgi:Putative prokaryotic signal transducing protein